MTKVRFAPSPTGKIHIGNLRAALINFIFAKSSNGKFVLRIDDTDKARSKKEYEEMIIRDLANLGLHHDEFYRQSERFHLYEEAKEKLLAEGYLYECFETAEEIEKQRKLNRLRGRPPIYNRASLYLSNEEKEKLKAEGKQPHYRFKLSGEKISFVDLIRGEVNIDTKNLSDPVLIREDKAFLYTLPSCVDDISFGITHIIRGEDHVTNSAVQIELLKALGAKNIPSFAHHSLLVNFDGSSLSKRLGSLAISEMLADGFEPITILSYLSRLGTSLMLKPTPDIKDLIEEFSFKKFSMSPAKFSLDELENFNKKIISEMEYEEIEKPDFSKKIWDLVKTNISFKNQAKEWEHILLGDVKYNIEEKDIDFCHILASILQENKSITYKDFLKIAKEKSNRKGKELFWPIRFALTGRYDGPELKNIFENIDVDLMIKRFSQSN